MNKQVRGNILLLVTAMIWGFAFVAQVAGMDHIGPYTFNALRNIVAILFLAILIPFLRKADTVKQQPIEQAAERKQFITGGIVCGIVLFLASTFQQMGAQYTSAGKVGFITILYIVIVPLITMFFGKTVGWRIWLCIIVASVGLYLLSIKENFTITQGDLLVFMCAIFFSLHILVIDYYSPRVDGVKLSYIQFVVCALLNIVMMIIFEQPSLDAIYQALIPILYAGIFSSGIGFTLQIIAQKDTNPTVASLILSLEAVFAIIGGAWLLGERLTSRELVGCVLIFGATIVAQLPLQSKKLAKPEVETMTPNRKE